MKTFRTSVGPFARRPYFEGDEIERMCSAALTQSGLLPKEPASVRIDRFIEKYFDVPIIYESLPSDVLGYTEFGARGVEAVHIAEPRSSSTAAERLIRSTIAHEGGHGLMHAHLFALDEDQEELFGRDSDVTSTKIFCRDSKDLPLARGYDGRWWEFQANQAIGALLLPKGLFLRFIELFLKSNGKLGAFGLSAESRRHAAREAAETFEVNPAVVQVRIDMLFQEPAGQLTL